MVGNGVVYIGENNGRAYGHDDARGVQAVPVRGALAVLTQDPLLTSTPTMVNGTLYLSGTNFSSVPLLYVFELTAAQAPRTLGSMRMRTLRTFALAVATVVPLAPVAASEPASPPPGVSRSAPAPTGHDLVRATFDDITDPDGTPVTTIVVTGSADVVTAVARRDGGEVRAATARPTQGRAVRLPAFDPSPAAPRAVIRISNASAVDDLNPGTQDFVFGAAFVLDALSSQPGTTDDGDNLVQRGLYGDPDQYKLQLDGRRPGCRLTGAVPGGTSSVEVTSTVQVDSSHWYRARCVRTGTTFAVVVTRFETDGTKQRTITSVSSPAVIDVRMNSVAVPLSIGGKLNPDGTVNVDSDQFNGRVDDAVLHIR